MVATPCGFDSHRQHNYVFRTRHSLNHWRVRGELSLVLHFFFLLNLNFSSIIRNLKLKIGNYSIIFAIFFVLLGFLGGLIVVKKQNLNNAFVVKEVIDGDTIKIDDDIRVRFIGINAPDKGECFYEESRDFTKKLLENQEVRLEKDISEKDIYDRLLRYVILINPDLEENNLLINDYLVRQGYAQSVASSPDSRYRDLLSSAQEEAIRENHGLWNKCDYERENEELREQDSLPSDPKCTIKGNISEKGYGMTYLIPGCDNYNLTKIDPRKGEGYFCTEKEAESAGFRKATNCP
jgi:micrococcal nuclease